MNVKFFIFLTKHTKHFMGLKDSKVLKKNKKKKKNACSDYESKAHFGPQPGGDRKPVGILDKIVMLK